MNTEDLAYLAGLIDGEGTICIHNNKRAYSVTTKVCVANCHRGVLEWCKDRFGGSVNDVSAKGSELHNWKPQYRWTLTGPRAERVVRLCQPFLIIKKEQARLFLEYRALIADGSRGSLGLDPTVHSARDALRDLLKAENRRGRLDA